MISCHCVTPIYSLITREKKEQIQEIFSTVILLNFNMLFLARNKTVKIATILLEVRLKDYQFPQQSKVALGIRL